MVDLRFDVLASPGLAEGVLRELRLAIMRGDHPAGQRLLEEELAREYGVSRGPVRDALSRLEQEGLARTSPRRGFYVVGLTTEAVEEIYDLRLWLETQAARLAAVRATDDQIDYLQHLVDTLADISRRGRYDMLTDPDVEFHRRVILAAGHGRLRAAWDLSIGPARALLAITTTIRHTHPHGAANHQPIVDAIRSHRPDDAALAMAEHMHWARTVMRDVVTGKLGRGDTPTNHHKPSLPAKEEQ